MSMKANGLVWVEARAGETPQECAAREILEETGLKAKPVLKGVITFPEFTPDLDWYTYVFKVTSSR